MRGVAPKTSRVVPPRFCLLFDQEFATNICFPFGVCNGIEGHKAAPRGMVSNLFYPPRVPVDADFLNIDIEDKSESLYAQSSRRVRWLGISGRI